MRKIFGALLALASIFGGLAAGVPTASAAGNYTVSISDDTASEGSPAEFTVFLQQFLQPPDTVSVRATTSDGTAIGTGFGNPCTATTDYVSRSAVVVLTNAQPTGTFVVQTCDDAIAESNETFNVTLSDAMADCGGEMPCSATIADGTGAHRARRRAPHRRSRPGPRPSPWSMSRGAPAPRRTATSQSTGSATPAACRGSTSHRPGRPGWSPTSRAPSCSGRARRPRASTSMSSSGLGARSS
jgi:hypothetical protein